MGSKDNVIRILGAGVAGMTAAITAARLGAKVEVYEHTGEALKKLSITGNGKCNFTNTDISSAHFHGNKELIESIISRFPYKKCIEFYNSLGIKEIVKHYKYDDTGYVYPLDTDAKGVREAFLQAADDLHVSINYNSDISDVTENDYPFIFACGSNSYPVTGSDSSVYHLLKKLNVAFNTFRPALCALYSKDPFLLTKKGRREIHDILLFADGNTYSSYGEVQFNEHSISGIPVMQVSRHVPYALSNAQNGQDMPFVVIDGHKYEIYKTAGFEASQCCSGGVSADCLDFETLTYKDMPGIFFAGEMIDIDGNCGGYNLHMAVATGYLAGISAYQFSRGIIK